VFPQGAGDSGLDGSIIEVGTSTAIVLDKRLDASLYGLVG
jgi:hypothetical protein